MAKPATNKVSAVKLRNGQFTQTGKDTPKELFRAHFPDTNLTDDSYDGQGQLNLGTCGRITHRGDWNLAKHVINQSEIRWALGTFKPFKSAGTDGIVPALLQQGMELLLYYNIILNYIVDNNCILYNNIYYVYYIII
jgi:hypothetical protein